MNIGQASKRSGVSAKMIRYYESTGLIPRASRLESGYRSYDEADVHTLGFIHRARDLGFSVEQISELLALWRDQGRASAQVKDMALGHVVALKRKINDLKQMVRSLTVLADHCGGDDRPECPILEDLASAQQPNAAVSASPAPDARFGFGVRHRRGIEPEARSGGARR